MANSLWHLKLGVVQRSKGNHAVKIAAYSAAARVELEDGTKFNFLRKRKEHRGHAVLLPDGAPPWAGSAGKLFAACEKAENRKDACTARLLEFAIAREIPPDQRMSFSQYVIKPLIDAGMAAQVDIHCPLCADGSGLEQPHCHVEVTTRRFDGDGFAAQKEKAWEKMFRDKRGKVMHALIAGRMNEWFEQHGLSSRVDHRSRRERGDDTPGEPDVSKRSWEAFKHRPDSGAAQPVHEILYARKTRREYQAARHAARQAEADLESAARVWQRHQPGVTGPGRQRRQNEPLSWNPAWSPVIGGAVVKFEIQDQFAILHLRDGGHVIDSGSRLAIKGKVTDQAIAVMIQQAQRHGWSKVMVTGSPEDQQRIAAALGERGIKIENLPTPEPVRQPRPEYRPSWSRVEN